MSNKNYIKAKVAISNNRSWGLVLDGRFNDGYENWDNIIQHRKWAEFSELKGFRPEDCLAVTDPKKEQECATCPKNPECQLNGLIGQLLKGPEPHQIVVDASNYQPK